MHAHFFYEQGEHINTNETELKLMLANGITTARILAGHPSYLEAKANVKNGKWIGPELSVASPQLVGKWPFSTEFKNYEMVASEAKANEAVTAFKQQGYDAIKITFMVNHADLQGNCCRSCPREDQGCRTCWAIGDAACRTRSKTTDRTHGHVHRDIAS